MYICKETSEGKTSETAKKGLIIWEYYFMYFTTVNIDWMCEGLPVENIEFYF